MAACASFESFASLAWNLRGSCRLAPLRFLKELVGGGDGCARGAGSIFLCHFSFFVETNEAEHCCGILFTQYCEVGASDSEEQLLFLTRN